jgi:hypothetical protein
MQVPLQIELSQDGYSLQHSHDTEASGGSEGKGSSAPSASSRADSPTLTKSRYLTGIGNPREMWFEAHGSSSPDVGEQWRLRQGQLVGELARHQFPEGTFVGGPLQEEHLQPGEPLFEVTVQDGPMLARIDVLRPHPAGSWILTEVKSSTLGQRASEKEAKRDLAFQLTLLERLELDVAWAEVMHLNPDHTRPGQKPLFRTTKLEDGQENYVEEVLENAPRLSEVLSRPEPPSLWPSRECNSCDCPEKCHDLPEHSIFTLPNLHWSHMEDIIAEGKATLNEVSGHPHLKPRHERYIEAVRSGEPYVDEPAIRDALAELNAPIHFFDFEAIDYALPKFGGTSPWQKIPFQYSLHVLRQDGTVGHREFLHDGNGDPRPALVESMLADVEPEGSIVVYHDTFEEKRLEELRDAFPGRADDLQGMIERLWDQAEVFTWDFIHPEQQGSWSLKNVLPVFAPDLAYDDLDIRHGMAAVVKYAEMVASDSGEDQANLRNQLLEYCERDTYAMVQIHRGLRELVG